ncbi:MAG: hypothetical protein Q9198_002383 [Flavoplaca austrocitrina]
MATVHIAAAKEAKTKSEVSGQTSTVHTSLFRHIFSSEMPPSEHAVERLTKEAEVLLGAGTVSTGRTLDFISYYVLADRNIRRRLEEELNEVMADYPRITPKLVELEKLDYFKALIKEGLRYVDITGPVISLANRNIPTASAMELCTDSLVVLQTRPSSTRNGRYRKV